MIDAIKKVMLAGVGAAAMSTEKAEKILNELVEKGKLSANDARDAARKLSSDGKREFDEATKALEERFDTMLKRLGRGQAERIDTLETKVSALEARVAALEEQESADATD